MSELNLPNNEHLHAGLLDVNVPNDPSHTNTSNHTPSSLPSNTSPEDPSTEEPALDVITTTKTIEPPDPLQQDIYLEHTISRIDWQPDVQPVNSIPAGKTTNPSSGEKVYKAVCSAKEERKQKNGSKEERKQKNKDCSQSSNIFTRIARRCFGRQEHEKADVGGAANG
ncbi:hypothetical protein K470DRAFT_260074 [Piedraia hortae CBS 480.64]|uniref:Uncharacterized protein n=1 Tax=Piedraia hortae CBS 480.64 TaxID=1314780 RepID=A0A6A7BSD6_9PEZI|nr:hypothetical protein K470DRAFT_260074 [Piedraia hortae CBS 480.64]